MVKTQQFAVLLQELLSILEPSVAEIRKSTLKPEVTSWKSIQLNVGAKRVSLFWVLGLTFWFLGFEFGFETFWFWVWDIFGFGSETFWSFCTPKKVARFHCQHCQKNLGIEALSKDSSRIWKAGFSVAKAGNLATGSPRNTQPLNGWLSIPLEDQLGFFAVQSCTDPEYARVSEFDKCYWRMRTFTGEHGSFVARMDTRTLLGR